MGTVFACVYDIASSSSGHPLNKLKEHFYEPLLKFCFGVEGSSTLYSEIASKNSGLPLTITIE